MPIVLWDKLCETSDLKYLVVNGEIDERAISIYDKIQSEIIYVFGISEQLKKQLKLEIKLELLWNNILVKGEKWKELEANVLESELENLLKSNKLKVDIYESIASIESSMKISIDYEKLTIRKYYNYCKLIEKRNKSYEKAKSNSK